MKQPLFFFSIRPPPGMLSLLGLLEQYMTPTLDSALLISSRAGAYLGRYIQGIFHSVMFSLYFKVREPISE